MSPFVDRFVVLSTLACALSVNGCAATTSSTPSAATAEATSAATAEAPAADGWQDLLPPADLHGFQRVAIDPGVPVASKPVWQARPDGSLFVDGAGAKEMLLSERELG